ncbi:MAG TPA: type I-E CRISPR-associated endonuclease Cas1e [Anaerolineaceae bacterium]|nr:type I-E CRISPR-associated endonuclease Cas1e [Anaerolineaceae bacterium]
MQDLHELPKMRDSLSYLYVEHAIVDRKDSAVEFINEDGRTHVPAANLCVLLLGPGTRITYAAVAILAECGCSIIWTGANMNRFYAHGMGETRKAYHLLRQAELVSVPEKRQEVVLRMYRKRFNDQLDPALTLPQIRGYEGIRMRDAYAEASEKFGVKWEGRRYDRNQWNMSDPINRALSAANALLNSLCHAAIISGGYSPALGFVHTGKQLSFVYDIADLYKTEITIPVAFEVTAKYPGKPEPFVRAACRDRFYETKLLARILPDIDDLLQIGKEPEEVGSFDTDPALPADLWNALLDVPKEA